ncbi:MAG: MqnA/MqnD/SBP family protein, partial [Campylobacterales bacterium]
FGKIDYLNLLPFHTFMKRYSNARYKYGVPSYINNEFSSKRVDGAFISSVKAKKYNYINLGIIAKKEVLSVLVIPHSSTKTDTASATSNKLAQILNIQGEVIIGDRALKYYLQNKPFIDLASEWQNKYNLPFVFALFCYHKDKKLYKKIEKQFLKQTIKIPQYILKQASVKTDIKEKDILNYLTYISYKLDHKAKKGLKLFQRLTSYN